MTESRLTNRLVGERIGLTPSAVSRLRSGTRGAGFGTMRRVETAYKWPVSDQAKWRSNGEWHLQFESVIRGSHARQDETEEE